MPKESIDEAQLKVSLFHARTSVFISIYNIILADKLGHVGRLRPSFISICKSLKKFEVHMIMLHFP